MISMDDRYFQWLRSQVSFEGPDYSYFLLMKDLHEYEFKAVVELDENRINDVFELRRRFGEETRFDHDYISGKVSVLEVLIRLAERATYIADEEDDRNKWFWIFLHNLGLDRFTDENYNSDEVNQIVWVFVNRRYTKTGNGGVFPMKRRTKTDQRLLELWYQLAEYLHEQGC